MIIWEWYCLFVVFDHHLQRYSGDILQRERLEGAFETRSNRYHTITDVNMGKKRVLVSYGVDIDAVAGWLGSYGGEDSTNDISRGSY